MSKNRKSSNNKNNIEAKKTAVNDIEAKKTESCDAGAENLKTDRSDQKMSSSFKKVMVVLGVLVLLAAVLIPAMLIFMDRAREKQYVIHAKSAYAAAQSVASELYSKEADPGLITEEKYVKEILKKAELDSIDCTSFKIGYKEYSFDSEKSSNEQHGCYEIKFAEYTEDGITVSYNGSKWEYFSSPEANLLQIK